MSRALLLLPIVFAGCRGGGTRTIDPPPAMPKCGDGVLDEGEDCDGSNLNGQTCLTQGFEAGQLTCGADCKFAKTLCTKRCGNGTIDPGEVCDGDAGVPRCATWGVTQCSDSCALDTSNCVTQAFEAAPDLTTTNGGPAVIADVPPAGVPDLVMAVPSRNRVELFAWDTVQGFSGATSRKLSFQRTPMTCVAADLNGDTALDVATINDDGAFDSYQSSGTTTFSLRQFDGGCRGARFVGVAKLPRTVAVAHGCDAAYLLEAAGVQRIGLNDAGLVELADATRDGADDLLVLDERGETMRVLAAPAFSTSTTLQFGVLATRFAAADLDGDADVDVAALVGNDVKVYENTGAALAEKLTFSASRATVVELRDFDLDGLPDVFFTAGDEVIVRRNRGAFAFTEHRQAFGAGNRLSVAVGDVDGDADLDVAITFSTGADATRTAVVRNRAR